MLFNSPVFIFGFLPVFYGVYLWLRRRDLHFISLLWVLLASLFFYAWWNPRYLPLLLGSIAVNFLAGAALMRFRHGRRRILVAGIVFNLALLGYFKYAGFIAENINALAGTRLQVEVVLPLAISFFTFQQIAFLVDAYRGRVGRLHPLEYAVFVSFFPQLIAGPIVHHGEMMPQFARRRRQVPAALQAVAISLFTFGLFKKTIIADGVAPVANAVFARAELAAPLSFAEALLGTLAYTLQLYYDFSGYSEMALGLALFIGIRLPVNFLSPYKSASIIEFWRRWHITLSRFLRDYLYIPLGGNRRGTLRRHVNLMITMLLGGLWHGAGWTFVIWGGYHGVLLMLNHGWNRLRQRLGISALPRAPAVFATFLLVMIGWVFFRAESLSGALHVLGALLVPDFGETTVHDVRALLKAGGEGAGYVALLIVGGLAGVLFLPSVVTWHLGVEGKAGFRPGWPALLLVVLMWIVMLYKAGGTHEFLYFQF
jgi:D-alanyl-lipoteichoic acid acyltransferase DltB (MBOAT superfamily)